MLERAARCLDSGIRPALHHAHHHLQSNRLIHQTFWRHGAGDLDLPAWSFTCVRALFEPHLGTLDGAHLPTANQNTLRYLDFLYPPNTQQYIKNFLRKGAGVARSDSHGVRLSPDKQALMRNFTSTARNDQIEPQTSYNDLHAPPAGDVDYDTHRLPQADVSSVGMCLSGDVPAAAIDTPKAQSSCNQTAKDAWEKYNNSSKKPRRMAEELISVLASSSRTVDAVRLIRLYRQYKINPSTISIHFNAMHAYLRLGEIGKAVQVHSFACRSRTFLTTDVPMTEDIFLHLLERRAWDLAFKVWMNVHDRVFVGAKDGRRWASRSGDWSADTFDAWKRKTFTRLASMPNYASRLGEMIVFLGTQADYFERTRTLTTFLSTSVASAVRSSKQNGFSNVLRVLESLKDLGCVRLHWNEHYCAQALKNDKHPWQQFQDAMSLYRLHPRNSQFRPSKSIISSLILRAAHVHDAEALSLLLAEWKRYVGPALTRGLMIEVMKFHAQRGETQRIRDLLEERPDQGRPPDLSMLYPILQSFASLASPNAARKELRTMCQEYGVQPDVYCQNIIIDAYARAHDYEGAMRAFNALFDSETPPNEFSFGIIMKMHAELGDTRQCSMLLDSARDNGIRTVDYLLEQLVLSLINKGRVGRAVNFIREIEDDLQPKTRTHLWNYCLTAHAMAGRDEICVNTLEEMQSLGVLPDSLTYAALIRVFCVKGIDMMDKAQEVFDRLLGDTQARPLAFHYAILIEGYIRQSRFDDARAISSQFETSGLPLTMSVRLARLRLEALSDLLRYQASKREQGKHAPSPILGNAERVLEDYLSEGDKSIKASEEPVTILPGTSRRDASVIPLYFEALLEIYARFNALDKVQQLVTRYARSMRASRSLDGRSYERPLVILLALMSFRMHMADQKALDELWNSAVRLAVRVEQPVKDSESMLLMPWRAFRLGQCLSKYLDALKNQDRHSEILWVYEDLLAKNFKLDAFHYNNYVSELLHRDRIEEAFHVCEGALRKTLAFWSGSTSANFRLSGDYRWRVRPRRARSENSGRTVKETSFGGINIKVIKLLRDVTETLRQGGNREQQLLLDLQKRCPRVIQVIGPEYEDFKRQPEIERLKSIYGDDYWRYMNDPEGSDLPTALPEQDEE